MLKLVTIYGGSGFIGRYVAWRMAKAGWRVRVACRRPNEALFVKTYGAVGQVEPVLCNIRDDASVRAVMQGADAVVNCVGTFDRRGKNNFDAVQHEGAARISRIAAENDVKNLVHISAIGADPEGSSYYAKSKGMGEQAVLDHFPNAVILRPSVVFGPEDRFFNKFAKLSNLAPVLVIAGGDTKFQPVYVDDVAQAAVQGATGAANPGVYELGGPEVRTLRQLMKLMLAVIQRRRLIINMPFWFAGLVGGTLDVMSALTLGLFPNTLMTRDQVRSLKQDNVVSPAAMSFADLGIETVPMEAVLPDYLWPYRPSGQYAEIVNSAKNLKT